MNAIPELRGPMEIFAGTAHPELARDIASALGRSVGPLAVTRFPDGEIHVRIETSVRGKDIFLVQPTCPPVNENFTELLIILDAFRRASAGRITAVLPYYGYARQDKKGPGREPITARVIANMLTIAGADRVLTVDLHSPQIQGFFDIPMDHLTAVKVLAEHLTSGNLSDCVIVSPDAGRVKTATEYANILSLPVAIIHKRRIGPEETEVSYVVGDVRGKRPIVIDDMITTGGTIDRSVDALLHEGAAHDVRVVVTHPVLVGRSTQFLSRPEIVEVVVANTIPISPEKWMEKISVVSVAALIAEAIDRIHGDRSVSELFD
jgi:ribose-phosphate pyrophosphokinase